MPIQTFFTDVQTARCELQLGRRVVEGSVVEKHLACHHQATHARHLARGKHVPP